MSDRENQPKDVDLDHRSGREPCGFAESSTLGCPAVLAFVQSSAGQSRPVLGAKSDPFLLEWREENAGAVGTMADEI